MLKKIKYEIKNSLVKDLKTTLYISALYKNEPISKSLDAIFGSTISKAMKVDSFKSDFGKTIEVYGNGNIDKLLLVGLGDKKKFNSDKLRSIAANIIRNVELKKITSVTVDSKSFNLDDNDYAQSFAEGFVLGRYNLLEYKTKSKKDSKLSKISVMGNCNKSYLEKGDFLGEAVNYSRDLGNHPPNILTPTYLANEALEIGKSKNFKTKVIDIKEFKKLGLGAFYGVAMGATEPAKFIIAEYSGGKKSDKPFGLIGKGLTFDSGGISLKPPGRMDEMKFDMCGGATVFGLMKAVSNLQPKINIVFAIGATENMPGSNAQRPGDIVTAYNGKTIEVLNTDAEGRLVLADVLSYVSKNYQPQAMIDFATLTGAVLVALGDRASGIMGNSPDLISDIQKSSDQTGEKVWELPLWDEYCKDVKSQIADIKNLGRAGLAGTISAGAFLKEFVDTTPWVHMDIAGTAWGPKEPSYMPKTGATGVAVRLIYNLVENRIK